MESRIICTEIWRNADFRKLDHPSRNVVLFLLTNDKIPVLPVYQIPIDEICFYCNIPEKKLIELIPDLTKFGIFFIEDYFVITNKFTRAKYCGGKTEEKRIRLHELLPERLKDLVDIEGDIGQYIAQSLTNDCSNQPSINHKPETINHKSITINHKLETNTEKKFFKKEDITDSVVSDLALKYDCPESFVWSCWDSACNWMDANGKSKKNYKAFLDNWVKSEVVKVKTNQKGSSHGIRIAKYEDYRAR
jgi:hypothetical protein